MFPKYSEMCQLIRVSEPKFCFLNGFLSLILLCYLILGQNTSICFHSLNLFWVIWLCGHLDPQRQKPYSPSEGRVTISSATKLHFRRKDSLFDLFAVFLVSLSLLKIWRYLLNVDGYFCHIWCLGNLGDNIGSGLQSAPNRCYVWQHTEREDTRYCKYTMSSRRWACDARNM
jgi:hypothetical protein